MLFQRAWYQAIDGHVAVHEDLLEDLAFATKIREAGGNVRVLRANGLLACSMYGDWSAFRRGWTRIFLEAAGRRPATLRKFAIRQEVIGTLPPVCMIGGGIVGGLMHMPLVWGAAAVLFVLQLAALSTVYAMAKQPLWCTLLFPFGCFEVGRAQRRAARLLDTRRPVKWGGKEYVLEPR